MNYRRSISGTARYIHDILISKLVPVFEFLPLIKYTFQLYARSARQDTILNEPNVISISVPLEWRSINDVNFVSVPVVVF